MLHHREHRRFSVEEYLYLEEKASPGRKDTITDADQWIMTEHTSINGDVQLSSVGVGLSLSSIYRGVLKK